MLSCQPTLLALSAKPSKANRRCCCDAPARQQEECGEAARVHGLPADSSSPQDMERLGGWVRERLGGVDIWLNNAGEGEALSGRAQPASLPVVLCRPRSPRHLGTAVPVAASGRRPQGGGATSACRPAAPGAGEVTAKRLLADVAAEEVVRVVGTNVVGSLLGCRQAVALMREQPGAGGPEPRYHIYNFGFSPWGAKVGVMCGGGGVRRAELGMGRWGPTRVLLGRMSCSGAPCGLCWAARQHGDLRGLPACFCELLPIDMPAVAGRAWAVWPARVPLSLCPPSRGSQTVRPAAGQGACLLASPCPRAQPAQQGRSHPIAPHPAVHKVGGNAQEHQARAGPAEREPGARAAGGGAGGHRGAQPVARRGGHRGWAQEPGQCS